MITLCSQPPIQPTLQYKKCMVSANPIRATPEACLGDLSESFGTAQCTLAEWIVASDWTKLALDFDKAKAGGDPTSYTAQEREDATKQVLEALDKVLRALKQVATPEWEPQVEWLERSGRSVHKDNVDKISIHVHVTNAFLPWGDIAALLKLADHQGVFDRSIYSNGRCMVMPGACKGTVKGVHDGRILRVCKPGDNTDLTPSPAADHPAYLAACVLQFCQHPPSSAQFFRVAAGVDGRLSPVRRAPHSPALPAHHAIAGQAALPRAQPAQQDGAQGLLDIPDEEEDFVTGLERHLNERVGPGHKAHKKTANAQGATRGYYFKNDRERTCVHGQSHASNHCIVYAGSHGELWYLCLAQECKELGTQRIDSAPQRADAQPDITQLVDATSTETHHDMARLLHHMYGNLYRSVAIKGKVVVYHFHRHRWEEDTRWMSLGRKMSSEVVELVERRARALREENNDSERAGDRGIARDSNSSDSDTCDSDTSQGECSDRPTLWKRREPPGGTVSPALALAARLDKVVLKLKNHQFKTAVQHEMAELCQVPYRDFYERLDAAPNLLGFANGVYDLDAGEFRAGRPEDHLTFSTGYDYASSPDYEIQGRIMAFLGSIMPSEEMVQFLLGLLAYSLHGAKDRQDLNLAFLCGAGGNGKGALKSLVNGALSTSSLGYCYEPDPALICTKKTNASSANPELARARGKRILFCSEPESDQKLQTSLLKRFTGGDKLQARELYSDNVEFYPQFTLMVLMNLLPSLSDVDGGIARRMNVVEFPFKFVESPTPDSAVEKMIDKNLDRLFKADVAYHQQFMALLLQVHRDTVGSGKGISRPRLVVRDTDQYLEDNNCVKAFLGECLDVTQNEADIITASNMYDLFKASQHFNGKDKNWLKQQLRKNGLESREKTTRGPHHKAMVYFGVRDATPMVHML